MSCNTQTTTGLILPVPGVCFLTFHDGFHSVIAGLSEILAATYIKGMPINLRTGQKIVKSSHDSSY